MASTLLDALANTSPTALSAVVLAIVLGVTIAGAVSAVAS